VLMGVKGEKELMIDAGILEKERERRKHCS